MVVSEMNDRLSPKNAPPITAATNSGTLSPPVAARSTASGTRATTVPTDVPMESDMKHAATNRPGSSNWRGRYLRVAVTVASMAPISLASDANAPARMKIHIMYMMFDVPAAREKVSRRLASGLPRSITTAHTDAVMNATDSGMR